MDTRETFYQNEQAALERLHDLMREAELPPFTPIEQIQETLRGSATWNAYQVLSWKNQDTYMSSVGVCIEATYLTLSEAIMYKDYLEGQGLLVALNR